MGWRFRFIALFMMFISSFISWCAEYLYPVSIQETTAFVIYQKNPYHIELWECDLKSTQSMQLLLSRLTPAGFRLLPDGKAFSFIDNGIVKIKNFLKRSPRALSFDAPLYQVEFLNWITNKIFYTSGKYQDVWGIFQIDYDGIVAPLYLENQTDCMYPQKQGNDLFYIERTRRWDYRICKTSYRPIDGDTFQDRLAQYMISPLKPQEIISFDKDPIIFLTMISPIEGFVIGHSPAVSRSDKEIFFDYYHLFYDSVKWHKRKLFRFTIKADLLLIGSPDRLYESILPLMPRFFKNSIIYMSFENNESSLYSYNCTDNTVTKIEGTNNLFPPIEGIAGGIIDDKLIAIKAGEMGVRIILEKTTQC